MKRFASANSNVNILLRTLFFFLFIKCFDLNFCLTSFSIHLKIPISFKWCRSSIAIKNWNVLIIQTCWLFFFFFYLTFLKKMFCSRKDGISFGLVLYQVTVNFHHSLSSQYFVCVLSTRFLFFFFFLSTFPLALSFDP